MGIGIPIHRLRSRALQDIGFILRLAIPLLTAGCAVDFGSAASGLPTVANGSHSVVTYDEVQPAIPATASLSAEIIRNAGDAPLVEVQETAVPTVTTTATWTPVPATPTATQTSTPSITPTASPTATPTETPLPTPTPIAVQGIPIDEFVILPPAVRQHVREIAARGRELGRNPNAFSKVGDSVALTPHYLTFFDTDRYTLGEFTYLQPTIDQFSGSFERYGVATRIGLHAWSLFDPLWANKDWCLPAEDMIACEFRLHNPSVLLIRLGSNDAGAAKAFDDNMRALVATALENGIVPILSTKADRFEGPDNRNNLIVREIALDFQVPLWDFDRVAEAIPGRGLGSDQVHMTMSDYNDYSDPATFERGYPVSDLTALMVLHAVAQEMAGQ